MARTRLAAGASSAVARPLAAPVRSAVSAAASSMAEIRPVGPSIQSTQPPMLGSPPEPPSGWRLMTLITPLPAECSAGITSTRCRDSEVRRGPLISPRVAAVKARRLASIASGIGTSPRSKSAPTMAGNSAAGCGAPWLPVTFRPHG